MEKIKKETKKLHTNASVGYVLYVLSLDKSNNFCESNSLAKIQKE